MSIYILLYHNNVKTLYHGKFDIQIQYVMYVFVLNLQIRTTSGNSHTVIFFIYIKKSKKKYKIDYKSHI
jgi:hypothetical protein